MALTKTPIELSSTPGIVDNSNATAITIDSSENVGIKETAPFGKLHISDTQTGRTVADSVGNLLVLEDDENGMSILSSNAGAGYILFGDAASAASGGIVYDHSANKFNFRTNDAWNRMILDASGNLLVGTTSPLSFGSGTTEGVVIERNALVASRANVAPLYLQRSSSDGQIANFYRDTSSVGSIGIHSSSLQIGTGNTQIKFSDAEDSFYVVNSAGVARDTSHDLGKTGARFKDLYLSGGVYLGGTGAVNKLDDYEEGTWTPVDANGNAYTTSVISTYTRIGRLVYFNFDISSNANTSSYKIAGLPFTSASSSVSGNWAVYGGYSNDNADLWGHVNSNGDYVVIYIGSATHTLAGRWIGAGSYYAA
jgi:hypothetical protein